MRNAIAALESMKTRLATGSAALTQRLAEIGAEEAGYRFAGAMYAGTNDVTVYTEEAEGKAAVIANGNAVAFIEFGAGVAANGGGDTYPGERPDGVVRIGEYGKGHGADYTGWYYEGEPGNAGSRVIKRGKNGGERVTRFSHTYGNPAAAPMYHAANTIREVLRDEVKEAFT